MTNTTLTPSLIEAVEALAGNLLASAPFAAFDQAYARFEADPQASGLMRSLTQAQANLRVRQGNGGLSQADISHFRTLQAEAQANRLIMDYIEAQNNVVTSLRETNQEISQWLGVDFAALARRPSSCCG
jgi:cell fate (sporulation/competence/biofilm development) regulator YlbF (YheA/YmcA/DUF963 family)